MKNMVISFQNRCIHVSIFLMGASVVKKNSLMWALLHFIHSEHIAEVVYYLTNSRKDKFQEIGLNVYQTLLKINYLWPLVVLVIEKSSEWNLHYQILERVILSLHYY